MRRRRSKDPSVLRSKSKYRARRLEQDDLIDDRILLALQEYRYGVDLWGFEHVFSTSSRPADWPGKWPPVKRRIANRLRWLSDHGFVWFDRDIRTWRIT